MWQEALSRCQKSLTQQAAYAIQVLLFYHAIQVIVKKKMQAKSDSRQTGNEGGQFGSLFMTVKARLMAVYKKLVLFQL